ncbi:MAG: hypothetical protein QOK15_596, partial [Nocardioidaceae bacterium]|nr:hypothetical protein [Nocardioidaceae bacterium]
MRGGSTSHEGRFDMMEVNRGGVGCV